MIYKKEFAVGVVVGAVISVIVAILLFLFLFPAKEEYSIELLNPEGEVRITTETKSDTISIDKVEEYILMDNL